MQDLFAELNDLMVRYHFRPQKKLSQNFLLDEKIIELMVDSASLSPSDTALEIGCGTGFLTRKILEKCRAIGVEFDAPLIELLKNEVKSESFTLLEGDFLSLEIPSFNKIVSSPPYAISSEIMFRLFSLKFELAVLLFQEEFADKLLAQPGFRKYNALTVACNYFCDCKMIKKVNAGSFFPKPPSESCILKLEWKKSKEQAKNDPQFIEFLKEVFRLKNKNFSNALQNSLPFLNKKIEFNEKEVAGKLSSLEFAHEKVYLLECNDFVKAFNELF
ncbi:MAG: 16S rRNA (adenine(1518)-N(6)/adenine(1519)-N(6))-dimethyltransferase RsmA [Candidatus Diapherotrites archaeon]